MSQEVTYRRAAKAARQELKDSLSRQNINTYSIHTEKIKDRCFCFKIVDTAKATALYLCRIDGATKLQIMKVPACNCKRVQVFKF